MVKYFMENPRDITTQNDIEKKQALPLCGTGFVGFVDG